MTSEQEIEIIQKRKNGVKIKQIMSEYCIKSVKTIYDIIKRNGIKKVGNKKYQVDESFFTLINSEEKAYWLGFLYADGYVRLKCNRSGQLKLKLSSKDREHIILFNNCISSNYPIKDYISSVLYKGTKSYSNVSEVSISFIFICFELIYTPPEQLANDHILSWTNEGDLVYDCFMGSGTTAKMSIINNRNWIGSEISSEYCNIIEERIKKALEEKRKEKDLQAGTLFGDEI